MSTGKLTIDLSAITANWQALDAIGPAETAATVKADAYGLGIERVVQSLSRAGTRTFCVAVAEEGAAVRAAAGPDAVILIFAGHMAGDGDMLRDHRLIPMLNSISQMTRHFETLPGHSFGVQLDTGMNRLGMEPGEWLAVRDLISAQDPHIVMSHLSSADDPTDALNGQQLAVFHELTDGMNFRRSLAATGGALLGPEFQFDLIRPGVGLYGGLPFEAATPTLQLSLPVIQIRDVEEGETVGYSSGWTADEPTRVATLSAGYADGILRSASNQAMLFAGDEPCPVIGRVSMDLLTVDVTHLSEMPRTLDLISPLQTIDDLAAAAGTIGYEVLTSLGQRYERRYAGG